MAPTGGAGGFDAVIGNPPYIRIQALQEWAPLEVEHYKRAYQAASKGNYDIYVVFVEKGLQLLNGTVATGLHPAGQVLATDGMASHCATIFARKHRSQS